MGIREIQAKSILIKRPRVDSWFLAGYGMNLYRGCAHRCAYCDGQAESYRAGGAFGEDVQVKTNALELLRKELDPAHHRNPFRKGLILVGGGVGDSYQPAEEQYQLTRGALKLMAEFGHPVHLLTKSTLVLRDIDLLKQINRQTRAVVSFSFSTTDRELGQIFEPGVPAPQKRLDAIRRFKSEGLTCGLFLMPVIPFITDTAQQISHSLADARAAGIDFVVFGGMTLKEGQQKDYFMKTIEAHFPQMTEDFNQLYPGDQWGSARKDYYESLNLRFYRIAKQQGIPLRMPVALCKEYVSQNDLVALILEQMDYILKAQGRQSSLGYAAYQVSKLKTDLREPGLFDTNKSMTRGLTVEVEKIIREILENGDCRRYRGLMNFKESD